MVLPSQFALTVELTKLIPLQLITVPAAEAVYSLARSLQNSGSDIIIEQDLAELFGRAQIEPRLSSSFRSEVARSSSSRFLDQEIRLAGGPGPTVGRALKQQPFFATVVQLSLFTAFHEVDDLAQGLTTAIEKKFAEALAEQRMAPGKQGIRNSLDVIEAQTSAYSWSGHIQAVGATLGLSLEQYNTGMQPTILAGLMDMLPILQQLPEDRMIHYQGKYGVCGIIVWAHHVLGLTVAVKMENEESTIRFGDATNPQVYIDASSWDSALALYDCSAEQHTELIKLKPDLDEASIESYFKLPLKGFATLKMKDACKDYRANEALLCDMANIIIALAMLIGSNIDISRSIGGQISRKNQILLAGRMLFEGVAIDSNAITAYVDLFRLKPLNAELAAPGALKSVMRDLLEEQENVNLSEIWAGLLYEARGLSILLLCVMHIADLKMAESFPIASTAYIRLDEFCRQIEDWNGKSLLKERVGLWFELLSKLLAGHKITESQKYMSLCSSHGWSVMICTLLDEDPAASDTERVFVFNAVPERNGVRKAGIVDGPNMAMGRLVPSRLFGPGGVVKLQLQVTVDRGKTLYGERDGYFSVSRSFVTSVNDSASDSLPQTHRLGHREMHNRFWYAKRTSSCPHAPSSSDVVLDANMVAIAGFYATELFKDYRFYARVLAYFAKKKKKIYY